MIEAFVPDFIDPIPWLILLPLAWATLAFLLGPRRGAWLAAVGLAGQGLLALDLAVSVLADGALRHAVGGWGAPLGIELMADGLAAIMLLMTAVVALPVAFHAHAYFARHPQGAAWFWPLTGFLLAALNALYLSADIFNLYVTLELMGLSAVALVAAGGGAAAIAAGIRYLLASLLGASVLLMGVALLYGAYGTVSLDLLAARIAPEPVAWLAAALILAGLMVKTALFPFHFWLPPAHGGAPAPVSALLSALVVKATLYLILRLWFGAFEPLVTPAAAQWVGVLGAAAIVWGSAMALAQTRLKMLVAYSTVAQLGYLFLLFPLATLVEPGAARAAVQGGTMLMVAHALAKAAMFVAAGSMISAMGRDDLGRLGGVASHLPWALTSFALAGITLMGLPPSGGFSAKWLLLQAALASGQWGWVAVMIVGGLLTAAYVFKVLRRAFQPMEAGDVFQPLPRPMELSALVLAAASLALGLLGEPFLALLAVGAR